MKPEALDCDVLVIGAGPAGGSAALAAASAGARVVILERRRMVGTPYRCAGFVPAPAIRAAELPDGVIVQPIRKMLTCTPDGQVESIAAPGFMIRRDLLDQAIAGRAVAAGARLMTGFRVSEIRTCPGMRISSTAVSAAGTATLTTDTLVGADGPFSIAGRFIGSLNRSILTSAQWTVPLREASDVIRIYFDQRLPGGYGWLFPLGLEAHAGVAVWPGVGVKPAWALEWFLEKLKAEGLIELKKLAATGGFVPVGGPLQSTGGRLILAGDAAGMCHPTTGAGIALALLSGSMAGEAAAAGLGGNGAAAIADYEEEIQTMIAPVLEKAFTARCHIYRSQGGAVSDYCRTIRQEWIGYPAIDTH